MREAARRLSLGIMSILAVSAALLAFDSSRRAHEPAGAGHRKWKVNILAFVTAVDSDDSLRGMRDGLAESLREGIDYEVVVRNAQGDMPTLSSLVDAALGDSADVILTLSTPTLQAVLQRVKSTPVVFSFSSNPLGAGAGASYEDHLPNVTGIATTGAYEETMELVRTIAPEARRLGTLVVPSEVNSVFNTEQMRQVVEEHGLELITVAVNSSSEISDAALALLGRQVDAICQVPSNLTITGFASITRPAERAGVPVFGFLSADAANGAVAVAARDYYESGKDAGRIAARVLRGESPATIPIQDPTGTTILVNLRAAAAAGLTIPPAVLARAAQVLE